MAKKRIIFTLLFEDGRFILSRNFRRQVVGDYKWLIDNYDFAQVAFYIDELVVLNVSSNRRENKELFLEVLRLLSTSCYVPIAAGGGITSPEQAREILRAGADKVVINTALVSGEIHLSEFAQAFGQQAIVASLDVKFNKNTYEVYVDGGTSAISKDLNEVLHSLDFSSIGEIYLNSIDRDGTGQGFNLDVLSYLNDFIPVPLIMAGGVGHEQHLHEGLSQPQIDAVATAHLHNFIGDGLQQARKNLRALGHDLGNWQDLNLLEFDQ